MKILAFIDIIPPYFMIKQWDEKCQYFYIKKLRKKNVKVRSIQFTTWDSVNKNRNVILKKQCTFYSLKQENFLIFHGYPYKKLRDCNRDIILPFLIHTCDIIFNGNLQCFDFVSKWLSFIFQNPSKKTQTVLVIIGQRGAGKNIWTNLIYKFLGIYANANAKLDNIVGSFNYGIVEKMLFVINEVGSCFGLSEDKNNKNKTVITEESVDINQKHIDAYINKNVATFHFH